MGLQFKKQAEIDELGQKLDALTQKQAKARQVAGVEEEAAIVALEADLERAQRAAYDDRQAEITAEQARALADHADTLRAIVEATQELSGLLAALDERQAQCLKLGVYPAASCVGPLQTSVLGTLWNWRQSRPELVGAPPKPSRRDANIADARASVARLQELVDERQKILADLGSVQPGSKIQAEHVLVLKGHIAALHSERARLQGLLLAKGKDMTQADRREALALSEELPPVQLVV